MNYVRTKDGILLNPAPRNCGNNEFGVYAGEEARQADTIEELCDWFVLRQDGKIYQIYAKEEDAVADLGQYSLAFEWLYAIETDKGLIYVAKMNDKGELELL